MQTREPGLLRELAGDLEMELAKLHELQLQVQALQRDIVEAPRYAASFYESLALKFHNFYTGCERIFSLISTALNGGVSKSADWHRRLLSRMTVDREDRKAVITVETEKQLQEFLGFRHVVRNIYGFELDVEKLDRLLEKYPSTWNLIDRDIRLFIDWLRELAMHLEPSM
ncbi:MAG: hypothetical protein WA947_01280 [Phormidesmis sp.]